MSTQAPASADEVSSAWRRDPESGVLLPIVVGVTGHRDLRPEDLPRLRELTRAFFAQLCALCTSTPLVVLSALAEGSDRLVARVALEAGHALVVPLPMPAEEYEHDFSSDSSREEFRELCRRAWRCFEVRDPRRTGASTDWSQQDARNRAYALVGAWISRHSQIVFALWDGEETSPEGGTSHIIEFELQGVSSGYAEAGNLLDPIESGAVYHIVTPRISRPVLRSAPFSARWLYPEHAGGRPWAKESYDRILKWLDAFNRDALKLQDTEVGGTSREDRLLPPKKPPLVDGPLPRVHMRYYGTADLLALGYQRWARRTLLGTLTLGVTAFIWLEAYDDAFPGQPGLLLLFPLLLLTAYLVTRWSLRRAHRDKYLDYRALAEGLRVQFFWRLVGLEDDAADHYLRKHSGELEWIREALRAANVLGGPPISPTMAGNDAFWIERCRQVCEHWIENQGGFFRSRRATCVRQDARLRRTATALFASGLCAALALSALLRPDGNSWRGFSLRSAGLLPVSLLLALAAAVLGYRDQIATAEQAKQYDRMATLFGSAAQKLRRTLSEGRLGAAREVFRDLGREALSENGDWVLLHRSHDLDIRQGA